VKVDDKPLLGSRKPYSESKIVVKQIVDDILEELFTVETEPTTEHPTRDEASNVVADILEELKTDTVNHSEENACEITTFGKPVIVDNLTTGKDKDGKTVIEGILEEVITETVNHSEETGREITTFGKTGAHHNGKTIIEGILEELVTGIDSQKCQNEGTELEIPSLTKCNEEIHSINHPNLQTEEFSTEIINEELADISCPVENETEIDEDLLTLSQSDESSVADSKTFIAKIVNEIIVSVEKVMEETRDETLECLSQTIVSLEMEKIIKEVQIISECTNNKERAVKATSSCQNEILNNVEVENKDRLEITIGNDISEEDFNQNIIVSDAIAHKISDSNIAEIADKNPDSKSAILEIILPEQDPDLISPKEGMESDPLKSPLDLQHPEDDSVSRTDETGVDESIILSNDVVDKDARIEGYTLMKEISSNEVGQEEFVDTGDDLIATPEFEKTITRLADLSYGYLPETEENEITEENFEDENLIGSNPLNLNGMIQEQRLIESEYDTDEDISETFVIETNFPPLGRGKLEGEEAKIRPSKVVPIDLRKEKNETDNNRSLKKQKFEVLKDNFLKQIKRASLGGCINEEDQLNEVEERPKRTLFALKKCSVTLIPLERIVKSFPVNINIPRSPKIQRLQYVKHQQTTVRPTDVKTSVKKPEKRTKQIPETFSIDEFRKSRMKMGIKPLSYKVLNNLSSKSKLQLFARKPVINLPSFNIKLDTMSPKPRQKLGARKKLFLTPEAKSGAKRKHMEEKNGEFTTRLAKKLRLSN